MIFIIHIISSTNKTWRKSLLCQHKLLENIHNKYRHRDVKKDVSRHSSYNGQILTFSISFPQMDGVDN